MRRVFALLCVPLAAGLLLWTSRTPSHPALNPQTPSCKPEAPIEVTLTVPDDGSTGVVRAAFSLRPKLELTDLRWTWELSQAVRVVEGEATGTAAPQRGALTERQVGLQMPDDGLHHTAKLIVTGVLRTSAGVDGAEGADGADGAQGAGAASADTEPELVSIERTLSWGPPQPVTATVLSPDAETGALVPVAVVPTSHVPAPSTSRAAGR